MAIEQGKKPPPAKHVDAYERRLADARRTASATALVRERRWADVTSAFAEHGDDLAREVAGRFEALRATTLAALDQLTSAHRELSGAMALRAFVDADNGGRFRPSAKFVAVDMVPVPHTEFRTTRRSLSPTFSRFSPLSAHRRSCPKG